MRLIDADALRQDWLENGQNEYVYDTNAVLDSIDAQSTIDAVEVVRCKDCKYIRPEVDAYTHEVVGYWCSFLDLGSIQDDHFCSYGERKDGDG